MIAPDASVLPEVALTAKVKTSPLNNTIPNFFKFISMLPVFSTPIPVNAVLPEIVTSEVSNSTIEVNES